MRSVSSLHGEGSGHSRQKFETQAINATILSSWSAGCSIWRMRLRRSDRLCGASSFYSWMILFDRANN